MGRLNEKKGIYKQIAVVAIPIALQSLVASSLNLVDNLMVGYLGEAELGAVGAGMQIYFISWIVTFGFSAGASTYVAQFWGAKDIENIKKTIGLATLVCVAMGLVFFCLTMFFPEKIMRIFTNIPETIELGVQYVRWGSPCLIILPICIVFEMALRSTQQTKVPMYISFVAFATNTFFNWIFIFGYFGAPALGVRGAALATLMARIVELALDVIVIFVKGNIIKGKLHEYLGWSRQLAKSVVNNSIPTMANEGAWALATAMYVAAYARVGVTEYAAFQAAETIDLLFIMSVFSLGDAALIIVGQKLGGNKLEEAYGTAKIILKCVIIFGAICGMVLVLFSDPLVHLFNFTEQGWHDARMVLIVYAVVLTFDALSGAIVTGVLRSGSDTRFAMLADVGTIWIIGVPMAWLTTAVLHWPIYVAVALAKLELLAKLIIVGKRFVSKKWVKNVVHDV